MKLIRRYVFSGLALALTPVGVVMTAPAALADCTSAGGSTICAQGEVRGGSDAPLTGPAYPGYCADPWYCSDDWGVDVYLNPGRPGANPPGINNDLPGRPGRPGGGGGGGGRPGGPR